MAEIEGERGEEKGRVDEQRAKRGSGRGAEGEEPGRAMAGVKKQKETRGEGRVGTARKAG